MEIAHGLGYEVAYGAASDHDEADVLLGNAVLSRMPIRRERVFPLPGRQSGESRSMLFTLIETPYGDLPVFVTHLNWELHHGSVRLEQVRFIVARVSELAPADGRTLPALLLGDFNAEPDSDEMRFLRGLSAIDGQSVYFADAWIYGGDGSAGATFDRANDYARLAHEPSRRIDYIYLQGPDEFLRGEPVRTQLAFTTREPASGIWPSDHFGVVSDVVLARRES
jgi:endonuclease/exonuclease/phosphatase family metal-dependent hydrolase